MKRMTTLGQFEMNPENLTEIGYKIKAMTGWWTVVVKADQPGCRFAYYIGMNQEGYSWSLDLCSDILLYDYFSAKRLSRLLAKGNPEETLGVINFADSMRRDTSRAIHPASAEVLSWPIGRSDSMDHHPANWMDE